MDVCLCVPVSVDVFYDVHADCFMEMVPRKLMCKIILETPVYPVQCTILHVLKMLYIIMLAVD